MSSAKLYERQYFVLCCYLYNLSRKKYVYMKKPEETMKS